MSTLRRNLAFVLSRGTSRRRALLGAGALALGAVGGAWRGEEVEARRCHRHNRRCKARCERRHAAGSLELSLCRSNCGVSCKV